MKARSWSHVGGFDDCYNLDAVVHGKLTVRIGALRGADLAEHNVFGVVQLAGPDAV